METIYTGTINEYTFKMVSPTIIEVWLNETDDYPFSQIFVTEGSVKNKKDFDYEISDWFFKHN